MLNDLIFRSATMADAASIMGIIDDARNRMLAEGKCQWNEAYPQLVHIEADIRAGYAYVLSQADKVVAYGAVILGEEPAYRAIMNGCWLSEGPYVVVHRLAVAGMTRQRGLGTFFMLQVEQLML